MYDLNYYRDLCHEANRRWWLDLAKRCPSSSGSDFSNCARDCPNCQGHNFLNKTRSDGELLSLCVSELSEALEGHRKGLQDDKLPHRKMAEVELIDFLIRAFDMAGGRGWDLAPVVSRMQVQDPLNPDGPPIQPPPFNPLTGASLDEIASHVITVTMPDFPTELMKITGYLVDCSRYKRHADQQAKNLLQAIELTLALMRDLGFEIQLAFDQKMAFNAHRADHKIENRVKDGGKKY